MLLSHSISNLCSHYKYEIVTWPNCNTNFTIWNLYKIPPTPPKHQKKKRIYFSSNIQTSGKLTSCKGNTIFWYSVIY